MIIFDYIEIYVFILRWYRQFLALNEKNVLVFSRRPLYLITCLFLPAIAVLIFFVGNIGVSTVSIESDNYNQAPSSLVDMGKCDAYYLDNCIQVAFAPTTPWTEKIMKYVSDTNDKNYGKDIVPFYSPEDLQVLYYHLLVIDNS